ncbi:MAG TPA: hypothetical protein VK623_10020 [Flavobacterium sp.]|nr:hypothetical protein [Flavobacterium sp.]
MKKIFLAVGAFLAFTAAASAQVEKTDTQQEDVQDKIQQEPPRETEKAVERAADVDAKNRKNVRAADEKLKKEKEKSTGKESKNPAEATPLATPVQPEPPKQKN